MNSSFLKRFQSVVKKRALKTTDWKRFIYGIILPPHETPVNTFPENFFISFLTASSLRDIYNCVTILMNESIGGTTCQKKN